MGLITIVMTSFLYKQLKSLKWLLIDNIQVSSNWHIIFHRDTDIFTLIYMKPALPGHRMFGGQYISTIPRKRSNTDQHF